MADRRLHGPVAAEELACRVRVFAGLSTMIRFFAMGRGGNGPESGRSSRKVGGAQGSIGRGPLPQSPRRGRLWRRVILADLTRRRPGSRRRTPASSSSSSSPSATSMASPARPASFRGERSCSGRRGGRGGRPAPDPAEPPGRPAAGAAAAPRGEADRLEQVGGRERERAPSASSAFGPRRVSSVSRPGTATTSRPRSSASRAVISEPDRGDGRDHHQRARQRRDQPVADRKAPGLRGERAAGTR